MRDAADVHSGRLCVGKSFVRCQTPVLLKAGDLFEVTVEKLGMLRNTVAAPQD
jgi:2-keto-4-pentenoate hydratase/2-oxohepta-3-ene-1,7-dioic acid hydratase in catechol pathway